MSEQNRAAAPKTEPAPDTDAAVATGPKGLPPHDRVEGPCSCGGPHWPGDCPMPTA